MPQDIQPNARATDRWNGVMRLRCEQCDKTEDTTSSENRHYVDIGWPKCCGRTMTLERKPVLQ